MCITVIGGFPLWMEPVNETIEGDDKEYGKIKCLNISKQYRQGKKVFWTVWNFDWI